jgi:hypothetical protein
MIIRPTFDKSYLIICERGKDTQKLEVVEATEKEVLEVIGHALLGRFTHPEAKTGHIPSTCVKVWTLDHVQHQKRLCRKFPHVYNLSPREVRLKIETQITITNK